MVIWFRGWKTLKNQLYIYPLSVRESQDTKLILAPWFTVVVEKVTQYGLLAQISQKSVAGCTIDGMQLHFLMNSFTFPVVS